MWALDFLAKYGFALSIVFQFFLAVIVLFGRDKFAPKSLSAEFYEHKDFIQDHFHQFDKRLANVESDLKHIPTKQEFHDLTLQMAGLTGELSRVDGALSGFKDNMDRIEKQYRIIDQHLRSSK